MSAGWIGNWSPGIGDPSFGGWATVFLYAWAAWASFKVLRRERQLSVVFSANERLVWQVLMVTMIALGINKQLDLQSALTEMGRILSLEQGWYGQRRQYQEAFIAAVPIAGLTLLAVMTLLIWNAPKPTLWACIGAAGLIIFVAIRAVSFHHVDEMLGWRLGGLPLNWAIEMGSLLLIGWGARKRSKFRS